MKKVLIVAAAAGLMTLAACQPATTNNTAAPEANAAEYDATAANEVDANLVDANAVVDVPVANETAPANVVE